MSKWTAVIIVICVLLVAFALHWTRGGQHSTAVLAPEQSAQEAGTWSIRFDERDDRSHFSSVAVCNGHAFMADVQASVILDVDLARGVTQDTLAWPKGKSQLGHPLVLGADCERRELYATGEGGAAIFSLNDRRLIRQFPFPMGFVAARGSVFRESEYLVVSGAWTTPDAWNASPLNRILQNSKSGLRLSLEDGAATSMFERHVAVGCPVFAGSCFESFIAESSKSASSKYFVGEKLADRIGIITDRNTMAATFSIRSPRFRGDTEILSKDAPLSAKMAWQATHSAIFGVYVINSTVCVVHGFQTQDSKWRMGDWIQFQLYLNTYTLDGLAKSVDLRLPGLLVGSDTDGLYVLDPGPKGSHSRPEGMRLVKIGVPSAARP